MHAAENQDLVLAVLVTELRTLLLLWMMRPLEFQREIQHPTKAISKRHINVKACAINVSKGPCMFRRGNELISCPVAPKPVSSHLPDPKTSIHYMVSQEGVRY